MLDFWMYFNIGLRHILDIKAYEHVLFLIGLIVPYNFKDWKTIVLLIGVFTIGSLLSLIFVVFGPVVIKANLTQWLLLIAILTISSYDLFTLGKPSKKQNSGIITFLTLCFGLIHGVCYSNYLKSIIYGNVYNKMLFLLEFVLGIGMGHIIVFFVVLISSFIMQTVFRFSKRDWVLGISAFIIGIVFPEIIKCKI